MATSEEKKELVDHLSGPRYYRISLAGYGGESAYLNLTKEQYEFWRKHVDEYYDSDLINYCVTDDPEEYEFEDLDTVPPEADFLTEDDFKSQWYEAPTEFVHQYGVAFDSSYVTIEEVDSGDYMSNVVADVIDNEDFSEWIYKIDEDNDHELENVLSDEDYGEQGEYVMQFYSSEKGSFFDGVIETVGEFDPTKLKVITTEYPNGEDIVTQLTYNGEDIDNNGGDTNGKGYSAHLWKN
jgi:hypothetical protein